MRRTLSLRSTKLLAREIRRILSKRHLKTFAQQSHGPLVYIGLALSTEAKRLEFGTWLHAAAVGSARAGPGFEKNRKEAPHPKKVSPPEYATETTSLPQQVPRPILHVGAAWPRGPSADSGGKSSLKVTVDDLQMLVDWHVPGHSGGAMHDGFDGLPALV